MDVDTGRDINDLYGEIVAYGIGIWVWIKMTPTTHF